MTFPVDTILISKKPASKTSLKYSKSLDMAKKKKNRVVPLPITGYIMRSTGLLVADRE